MDAAKNAIKNFTSRDGKHDTTVQESVAPAVTNETVIRQQEDRVTTAIDKEVHQDHYHTSVQPVNDSQVLPEKHHHNLVGVEHRKFEHDDPSRVQSTLQSEQAQFKDQVKRVDGQHTTAAQPVIGGEHVHHHVHETIQPVVNKQTIEPHVVHTTVPVHEVHHNASQHHTATALPAMSMADFKKSGGSLSGRDERTDKFDGCPTTDGINVHGNTNDSHSHGKSGGILGGVLGGSSHNSHGHKNDGINEVAGSGVAGGGAPLLGKHDHHNTSSTTTHGSSVLDNNSRDHHTHGNALDRKDTGITGNRDHDLPASLGGHGASTASTTGSHGSSTHAKPSLLDKLNPMKDSNGDGKAGFMK